MDFSRRRSIILLSAILSAFFTLTSVPAVDACTLVVCRGEPRGA